MRTKLFLLLFLGALTLRGAAPESAPDKLRRLVKLPVMSFGAGVKFDTEHGFSMFNDRVDYVAEIAPLKKQLTGGTEDAARHYQLGNHYAEIADRLNAKRSFDKAVELYRKRAEVESSDGRVLAEFGRALWAARKMSESENIFRQAVRISPRESKCWIALGQLLDWQARQALAPADANRDENVAPEQLVASVLQTKPSLDQLSQAQKLLKEADGCFDQAAAVAPQDPEPFVQRALHKSSRGYLEGIFGLIRGEPKEPEEVMKGMFTLASIPDLQEAARLSPTNYQAIATTAFFEAMFHRFQHDKGAPNDWNFWNVLPESSRKSIQSAMTRLEDLGQNANPKLAAGALEGLALIQALVVGDLAGGRTTLRRAVTVDPTREQAWDMLVAILAQSETFDELQTVCEERVKKRDSARNRVILAKTYEKLHQLGKADQQIKAALNLESGNMLAHLSQAALLLKRKDNSGLSQAKNHLDRAQQILTRSPRTKDTNQQTTSLLLTSSLFYALKGDMNEARQLAKQVIERDKDNEDAKEILAALGP